MSRLLPNLQSLVRQSGGVADQRTARALRALEDWAIQLTDRLARLDVTAEAVGGVSSVSAGSGAVTVSPTVGAVVVDVVEANFSGIPQSGVTNLVSDLSTLSTQIAGKAPLSHGHAIADVTGLQTALDGKSAVGHGHAISDVTGLQTALDGKSDVGHTHSGMVTGTGTANTLTKWTGTGTVGNSRILDDGLNVTIIGDRLAIDQGTSVGRLRFVASGGANYVQSGLTNTTGSAAPLVFTTMNNGAEWGRFDASGNFTFQQNLTVNGNLSASGNATLGNAATNAHVLNGTLNANSTAGSNGQVLQMVSGLPKWSDVTVSEVTGLQTQLDAKSDVGHTHPQSEVTGLEVDLANKLPISAVSGTTDFHAKFTGSNSVGDSIIEDDGFTAEVHGALVVDNSLSVAGDLVVEGDMVINDAVNGFIEARILQANYISTASGSGGNIEADGGVNAKMGYSVGDPGSPTEGYIYLGRQIITASGTYTPTPNTRAVRLRIVGGGGGGGSKYQLGSTTNGGGGASGMYIEKWISSSSALTGGAVTIGSGGSGGNNSTGGTGGDTSIVINGTTYTAKGGLGGTGAIWNVSASDGGAGQSSATTGDVKYQEEGGCGFYNQHTAGTFANMSGKGGSNPLGCGGQSVVTSSSIRVNGKNGQGYGGGGSGSVDSLAAGGIVATGGAGAPGVVIVEEYG